MVVFETGVRRVSACLRRERKNHGNYREAGESIVWRSKSKRATGTRARATIIALAKADDEVLAERGLELPPVGFRQDG